MDHLQLTATSFALSPAMEWLPDETVFSLCSRLHFLSGHHVPTKTNQLLFGTARAGSAHDVPAHVQALVTRLPNLGDARAVIRRHTLLPFYFPFHEAHRCQSWVEQMALGSASKLKAQLGLASTGYGAAHPLKACTACMDEDVRLHGVAYWHVSHQLPGVIVCPVHHTALVAAKVKVSGKDRFGWMLPTEVKLIPIHQSFDAEATASELAKASLALHAMPTDFCFDNSRLVDLYMHRLIEMGWTRRNCATISRSAFEPALRRFLDASCVAQVWPWMINEQGAHTMAERLIRICRGSGSRESRHPLNHLILQLMLFGTWDAFLEQYQRDFITLPSTKEPRSQARARRSATTDEQRDTDRNAIIAERMAQGVSATQVAKEYGVTVSTAMTWACKAGVAPSRRPKSLKEPVRRHLVKALSKGEDKQTTAQRFGLSVQTITRLLLTEPGLHQTWLAARFLKEQTRCRSAWTRVMASMPSASCVLWRRLEPAAYAWLYRNDRAWLQEAIAKRPQPASITPTRRDWTARDQSLCQLVQKAGFNWMSLHPHGHPTLAMLCTEVQGLRQVLSVLHKLPLTQLAILEVCRTQRRRPSPQSQSTLVGFGDGS